MSPERRAEQRRRFREVIRLARTRLDRTGGGRVGRAMAWVLLVAFGGGLLADRWSEATPGALLGYAPSAARTAAWLAAGPVALAAAHRRRAVDEAEGIGALLATFGVARAAADLGRAAAATLACARAVAIPAFGAALVAAALQPSPMAALRAAALLPAVAAFAATVGLTVGATATVCDRVSPDRGRSALAFVVLVPWAIADAAGHPGASIPGALDAVLRAALGLAGLERAW